MALSEDPIQEVRQLQAVVADATAKRTTAIAHRDQAQTQLSEILAANGVATIDELAALTEQARSESVAALQAAKAALGLA